MKISVKVKLNSKEGQVEEVGPHQLLVKVKAPAQENKANQELRERLAEYLPYPKITHLDYRGFEIETEDCED